MVPIDNVRREPPSKEPNNQDVFVWSLYLLGGSDRDVNVEDVTLKCFEIAPARFGWRTHPEIPDGVKGVKALSVAESKSHKGLIHKTNKFERRLTAEGVRWVENFKPALEGLYSGTRVAASHSTNTYERRRRELKASQAWLTFQEKTDLVSISDAAAALQCSPASPLSTWDSRINDLKRTADFLADQEVANFALFIEDRFIRKFASDN